MYIYIYILKYKFFYAIYISLVLAIILYIVALSQLNKYITTTREIKLIRDFT